MHRATQIPITVINPMLTCKLCKGYLIDATTIVECLHSFCRSCIVSYLKLHTTCPVCDTLLHKTRPHLAIRPDRSLQAIVYKLIPNLFEKEMSCRRSFFKEHPSCRSRSLSPEKRGEITLNAYVLQEEEHISVELAYWQPPNDSSRPLSTHPYNTLPSDRSIYLLCPPDLNVAHLEKLIRVKFGLEPSVHRVVLFISADDLFSSDYTLSDLACLYAWRRIHPLKLFFAILEDRSLLDPNGLDSTFRITNLSKKDSESTPPCSDRQVTPAGNLPLYSPYMVASRKCSSSHVGRNGTPKPTVLAKVSDSLHHPSNKKTVELSHVLCPNLVVSSLNPTVPIMHGLSSVCSPND